MSSQSIYTIQNTSNSINNTNYGVDTACTDDLPLISILISGTLLLANAVYRRIITPYGALALIGGDPEYGVGVINFLNDTVNQANISSWQTQITTNINQDVRIQSSTCLITQDAKTSSLTFTISVQPFIGQSFTLITIVDNLTGTQLVSVTNT